MMVGKLQRHPLRRLILISSEGTDGAEIYLDSIERINMSPMVLKYEVVATLGNSREFSRLLMSHAWVLCQSLNHRA